MKNYLMIFFLLFGLQTYAQENNSELMELRPIAVHYWTFNQQKRVC